MSLNSLSKEIHENAVEHGWWDEERSFGEIIALCHSELSEALEEYRSGHLTVWQLCLASDGHPCLRDGCGDWSNGICELNSLDQKPEGMAVEMADCIIRILDWCGKENIDIDDIIHRKMEYNKTRPYRHGGKAL